MEGSWWPLTLELQEIWNTTTRWVPLKPYLYGSLGQTPSDLPLCLQTTPPQYHVQDMKVPTALFSGGQDTLADPKDVAVLLTQVSSYSHKSLQEAEAKKGNRQTMCVRRYLSWSSISILNTGSIWTSYGDSMHHKSCSPTSWNSCRNTSSGRHLLHLGLCVLEL